MKLYTSDEDFDILHKAVDKARKNAKDITIFNSRLEKKAQAERGIEPTKFLRLCVTLIREGIHGWSEFGQCSSMFRAKFEQVQCQISGKFEHVSVLISGRFEQYFKHKLLQRQNEKMEMAFVWALSRFLAKKGLMSVGFEPGIHCMRVKRSNHHLVMM